ncbi:MAG: lipoate--protein ligase [Oscillospiraceae bacterium]|nr:lipoate--protein ligase [Oscillospiraceae bacterium]
MLLIKDENHEPSRNIAIDAYMLMGMEQEVCRLWRNDKAVIIGRNQNAVEEIDLDFVKEHDVKVIRRLSGGGAVFHDLGNICFTFVAPYHNGEFNNYEKFTAPIRDYLRTLGVQAELSGRNDLTVDGMKISGNAQTVHKGRIMHHGTLLFSSNVNDLAGALRPKQMKIESKGIKSVRSRITNISAHLQQPMTVEQFQKGLEDYLLEHIPDLTPYVFGQEDHAGIDRLVEERFANWEWNFGHSPNCDIRHSKKFSCGIVEAALQLEEGKIAALTILGDFFGIKDKSELEEALVGLRYDRETVLQALEKLGQEELSACISGITTEEFCGLLMGDC